MLKTKFQYPLFLSSVSLWWGLTFFADILIAPSIFRIVENFFNAGDLAMALFSRLNYVEVIVSTIVVSMLALMFKRKRNVLVLAAAIVCWSLAIFYFAYLIPKIISLTELWKVADKMGVVGIEDVPDVQQAHQFYHRIYVTLDVIKLLLLSFLMIFGLLKEEKLT